MLFHDKIFLKKIDKEENDKSFLLISFKAKH